jgi:hypothetical protein
MNITYSSHNLHNVQSITILKTVKLPNGEWMREINVSCGTLKHSFVLYAKHKIDLGVLEEVDLEEEEEQGKLHL